MECIMSIELVGTIEHWRLENEKEHQGYRGW
jgi:hypothetical protein